MLASDRQVAKYYARVLENLPELPASDMQRWIDDPLGLQSALRTALAPVADFTAFPKVRRGGHTTPENSRKILEAVGSHLLPVGSDILSHADYSGDSVEELEIAVVTNAELGLTQGGPRSETYRLAQERGLGILPHWAAAAILEVLPSGNRMFVATEPIVDTNDYPRVFHVEHSSRGRWLGGSKGSPDRWWSDVSRWAFVRRK